MKLVSIIYFELFISYTIAYRVLFLKYVFTYYLQPGRRELLLSKMLIGNSIESSPSNISKIKQKDLPAVERMRRERARQQAVDAYRALKKKPIKT